jgi:hypothetical protein
LDDYEERLIKKGLYTVVEIKCDMEGLVEETSSKCEGVQEGWDCKVMRQLDKLGVGSMTCGRPDEGRYMQLYGWRVAWRGLLEEFSSECVGSLKELE